MDPFFVKFKLILKKNDHSINDVIALSSKARRLQYLIIIITKLYFHLNWMCILLLENKSGGI